MPSCRRRSSSGGLLASAAPAAAEPSFIKRRASFSEPPAVPAARGSPTPLDRQMLSEAAAGLEEDDDDEDEDEEVRVLTKPKTLTCGTLSMLSSAVGASYAEAEVPDEDY